MKRIDYDSRKNLSNEDRIVIEAIRSICARGNDVEIRRNKDGSLKVFEIKKNIAVG